MNVLSVAADPAEDTSLNLEGAVTELQRRLSDNTGEPVDSCSAGCARLIEGPVVRRRIVKE